MTHLEELDGKPFAVILVDYTEGKEGAWHVFRGQAKLASGRLFVDRGTDTDFPIPDNTLDRIKQVTPQIASVVGDAEYFTMLTVGPLLGENLPHQSSEPTLASVTPPAGQEARLR